MATTVIAVRQGGVPAGGTTSQVLTKNSNTDYDIAWAASTGAGGITLGQVIKLVKVNYQL